jgi:hypothetical protein
MNPGILDTLQDILHSPEDGIDEHEPHAEESSALGTLLVAGAVIGLGWVVARKMQASAREEGASESASPFPGLIPAPSSALPPSAPPRTPQASVFTPSAPFKTNASSLFDKLLAQAQIQHASASTPTATPPPKTAASPTWRRLSSVSLVPGATYFARLALSPLEKAFASDALIAQKLAEQGFANVRAWTTPAALPASIPYDARANPDGPWAMGTWAGAPQAAANLPSSVQEVWVLG